MKTLFPNTIKFVITLALLFSCSKVSEQPEERPSYLRLSSQDDVRLYPLIDSIWHYERHRPAIGSIVSNFGVVRWDKGLVGYRGKTLVAVIPLCLPSSKTISGFIAFEMDSRIRFRFYSASRGSGSRSITNVVNALNFKVFGTSLLRIDDPDAMSRREAELFKQARSAHPNRNFRLNVRMVEATTCYSWVSCIGDGNGNCVSHVTYHSECITSVVWAPDWYFEEPWEFKADSGLGGDGGSGEFGDEGMEAFVVPPPDKPITNINKYVDCFTASKRAKITFYADQPVMGTSLQFSVKEKAGHAFITIQQDINGTTIMRSLGFYSRSRVDPFFSTSGISQLGDNSNESYDVKLTVEISGIQLASILEIIKGYNPVYDLEKYNCTNFVLDISDAAGLHINRTVGKWGVGSGLNPSDFGEDLKRIPGVVTQGGKSPANLGDCD